MEQHLIPHTASEIAALNDRARRTFTDCRVVITRGISALGASDVQAIITAVQQFDDFTEHNDPYGEHDFGKFAYADCDVFWKWDYYDLDLQMASLDPSNPDITTRVLTIMLAEEY